MMYRYQRGTATIRAMEGERLLKVGEVAERLRVRPETVLRWIKQKKIRGSLIGGKRSGYRISESELERLIGGSHD